MTSKNETSETMTVETPEVAGDVDMLLDGLTEKKSGQGAGGNGGTRFAGVESRKFASAQAFGAIRVLGYGRIPAAMRLLTDAAGHLRAKSALGAQIGDGVAFTRDGKAILWSGYGEFSDYIGYVAANAGNLTIGTPKHTIQADGQVVKAPSLVDLITVCEARRGGRYVGEQAKVWSDAPTQARHGKAGNSKG